MSYPKMLPDPVMSPDDYLTSVASRNSYPTPKRKAKQFWKKHPIYIHTLILAGEKQKQNYNKNDVERLLCFNYIKSPKCLRLPFCAFESPWSMKCQGAHYLHRRHLQVTIRMHLRQTLSCARLPHANSFLESYVGSISSRVSVR